MALTFDACWSGPPGRYDARIAQVLEKESVPATFLLSGVWARRFPAEVKALAANPLFQIGNHSWDHTRFAKISENQMRWQLEQTEGVLQALTGKRSAYFRPPFGESGSAIERVASAAKMQVLLWSVDGSSDKSIDRVAGQVRPGSIVTLGLNGAGWRTAEALSGIVQALKAKGYTFAHPDGG